MTPPKTSALQPGQYLTMRLKAEGTPAQDAPLRISGVANDASVTDSFGTRIKLTQRALDGFMANPVMLLNHDVHNPIGKFTSIEYRGNKLHVEGEIDPGARTNTGASVADLTIKGILKAFSVRFDEAAETRTKDYTQLDANVLDEISIVTLPSNRASLFGLRSKGVMLHGAPELLDQDERRRVVDARQDTTRAAGPLSLDLLTTRLRKLVRESCGEDNYWDSAYLVAVYDDTLVWTTYDDARFWRCGYSVDGDGNVSLSGAAQEVIPAWTDVNAAAEPEARSASVNIRLAPEDMAEIVRLVREAAPIQPVSSDPTSETPDSEPESPVSATTTEPPTPTLEDVRSALRSAAQSVNSAPPG